MAALGQAGEGGVPISGSAMLITAMDIDPADEPDFNRWYDREHLAERVAIPGFVEARRLAAVSAEPKYLNFYTTETIDTFTSDAYQSALKSQTDWSLRNLARFKNPLRAIVRITASHGFGRGGAVAFLRLRPGNGDAGALRAAVEARLAKAVETDHVVSAHLFESDPELSKPLPQFQGDGGGSADWYVAIEGTDADAVRAVGEAARDLASAGLEVISLGTYYHLWDLASADLPR